MMHGPCGDHNKRSPCMMKDNKCSKEYPKEFCEETTTQEGGFPKYRRPNDGSRTIRKNGIVMNNTRVVPHNVVDLLVKYNANIIVEICNTAKLVKYFYKYYVYKAAVFNNFCTAEDVSIQALVSRTILTTRNTDVAAINDHILYKLPGEYMEYISADTVVNDEFRLSCLVDYLESMKPGSLPPHQLKQKVGRPVMALKNLSLRNGVSNGAVKSAV